MKTSRLHSVHRSLAHSAGATFIVLAAALAWAAPVAAHTAALPDRDQGQASSCQTTRVQRQGLEDIVWGVLFGPQGLTPQETRCDDGAAAVEQEETRGVMRPVLAP
ncbi:hypothetical protein ACFCXS_08375 [Streptomyces sp. NPDC056373]|uniref:hypothetical protein n=1 Tax=Streptomyces sp. NPDC056373 TaxID=3345798 RepID=UPI0035E2B1A7